MVKCDPQAIPADPISDEQLQDWISDTVGECAAAGPFGCFHFHMHRDHVSLAQRPMHVRRLYRASAMRRIFDIWGLLGRRLACRRDHGRCAAGRWSTSHPGASCNRVPVGGPGSTLRVPGTANSSPAPSKGRRASPKPLSAAQTARAPWDTWYLETVSRPVLLPPVSLRPRRSFRRRWRPRLDSTRTAAGSLR